MKYPKLISVKPQQNFFLTLEYENGEIRQYDFSQNFSHPFYASLNNFSTFQQVTVIDGDLEWATGQDFCPFTLYDKSIKI